MQLIRGKLLLLSLLLYSSACQRERDFIINDVGSPQRFELGSKSFMSIDPSIDITVDGQIDGKAYIYIQSGKSSKIFKPQELGHIVWLKKGQNKFRTSRSTGVKDVYVVYVPVGTTKGHLVIRLGKWV